MTQKALELALGGITKVPTLTHGLMVKLADVEAAIKEALAQPPLPVQRQPLTDEQHEKLWEAIRATGYLTKGQVDEVMEVVESHIGAK